MIRGLYAAATALDAATLKQDVVSENLAHVNTPGCRALWTMFEIFDRPPGRALGPVGDIVGTRIVEGFTDFRSGGLQQTGHPYDLAITTDAFFADGIESGRIRLVRFDAPQRLTRAGPTLFRARTSQSTGTTSFRSSSRPGTSGIPTTGRCGGTRSGPSSSPTGS
jgi:flagellar basal body rod protein FlgG